jgi:hypothetical protein
VFFTQRHQVLLELPGNGFELVLLAEQALLGDRLVCRIRAPFEFVIGTAFGVGFLLRSFGGGLGLVQLLGQRVEFTAQGVEVTGG